MFKLRKKKLKEFCIKYNIDLLVLFGSFAKGTNKKSSDIDFAYYSRKEQDDIILLDELYEIFENEFEVDLVNLEREDLKPYIKYRIFSEGIVVFESIKNLFRMYKERVFFEYVDSKRFEKKKNKILRSKIV